MTTEKIDFQRAYYVKLGRGGEWEQSSISESKLRIGWGGYDVQDINRGDWEKIAEQLLLDHHGNRGKATRDLHALRWICESTHEDLWITFASGRLWWCRLGSGGILQDAISKYRLVDGKWLDQDIQGRPLEDISIPGEVSKIQGFRGTICRVHDQERKTLHRLVNDDPSDTFKEMQINTRALADSVAKGVTKLHWKDFETFVDLVFSGSGWRRVSMLGETMKGKDLILEDPITRYQYLVQVKSGAKLEDFDGFLKQSEGGSYEKRYFVVHSPDKQLAALQGQPPDVELILPDRLSEMAVRLGLADWLLNRIK